MGVSFSTDNNGHIRWSFGNRRNNISGRGNPFELITGTPEQKALAEMTETAAGVKNLFELLETAMNPYNKENPAQLAAHKADVKNFVASIQASGGPNRAIELPPKDALELDLANTPRIKVLNGMRLRDIMEKALNGRPELAQEVAEGLGIALTAAGQAAGTTLPKVTSGTELSADPRRSLINEMATKLQDMEATVSRSDALDGMGKRYRELVEEKFATLAGGKDKALVFKGEDFEIPVRKADGNYDKVTIELSGGYTAKNLMDKIATEFGVSEQVKNAIGTSGPAAAPAPGQGAATPAPGGAGQAATGAPATAPTAKIVEGLEVANGKDAKLYTNGGRKVDPNEAPKISENQVKQLQEMLGVKPVDSKYGPDTHAAFVAKCKAANIDPHKVDFTKPDNPGLVAVMGQIAPNKVATAKPAPAVEGQPAPSPAPAASPLPALEPGDQTAGAARVLKHPVVTAAKAVGAAVVEAAVNHEMKRNPGVLVTYATQPAADRGGASPQHTAATVDPKVQDLVQTAVFISLDPRPNPTLQGVFQKHLAEMAEKGVQFPNGTITVLTSKGPFELEFNGQTANTPQDILKTIGDAMEEAGIGIKKKTGLDVDAVSQPAITQTAARAETAPMFSTLGFNAPAAAAPVMQQTRQLEVAQGAASQVYPENGFVPSGIPARQPTTNVGLKA